MLFRSEYLSTTASRELAAVTQRDTPAFRRMQEDLLIQIGLGKFFAAKLRSAIHYAVFEKTDSAAAGQRAVMHYQDARDAWVKMATRAKAVYKPDIAYGSVPGRRGHWMDRIPTIDKDLAVMREKAKSATTGKEGIGELLAILDGKPQRSAIGCTHTAPSSFTPGNSLALTMQLHDPSGETIAIQLFYRHVNQAERWQSAAMERKGSSYIASIPGAYTDLPYPLQYYFELKSAPDRAWLHPGFPPDLAGQPYYVVRESRD